MIIMNQNRKSPYLTHMGRVDLKIGHGMRPRKDDLCLLMLQWIMFHLYLLPSNKHFL